MVGHAHHRRLDEPNGPTSIGRCDCGLVRSFRNFDPDDRSFEATRDNFNGRGKRISLHTPERVFHLFGNRYL